MNEVTATVNTFPGGGGSTLNVSIPPVNVTFSVSHQFGLDGDVAIDTSKEHLEAIAPYLSDLLQRVVYEATIGVVKEAQYTNLKQIDGEALVSKITRAVRETVKEFVYASYYHPKGWGKGWGDHPLADVQQQTNKYTGAINKYTGAINKWHVQVSKALKSAFTGLDAVVVCPVTEADSFACGNETSVWQAVQHLNDHHKWTYDQIADWLDTLDVDLSMKEKQ